MLQQQEPSGDPTEIANVIRHVRPGNGFEPTFPLFARYKHCSKWPEYEKNPSQIRRERSNENSPLPVGFGESLDDILLQGELDHDVFAEPVSVPNSDVLRGRQPPSLLSHVSRRRPLELGEGK